MNYKDYITIDPNTRSGMPCIRGTRVTVKDVLERLASGLTQEEILEDFPVLTHQGVQACLAFAADREAEVSDRAAGEVVPRQLDDHRTSARGSKLNDSLTTEMLPSTQGYVGEVALIAGFYLPENWRLCDGSLLPISLYTDLFSTLGTKFGGDGKTTFELPNLLNDAPKNMNYIIRVVGSVPSRERIPERSSERSSETETLVAELQRRLALLEAKLTELNESSLQHTSAMNFAINNSLPIYPGFQAIDSSSYYKSPSTLAAFRYKSAAKYHDVKSFYSTALIQQGWRLTNEWDNADLSAIPGLLTSGLTFSKGEYSVVIAYSGEKAIDLDSNYEIDIRWDEK